MVDFSLQRLNMVESQVRPSELMDRRIARAMMDVAREAFLPEALQQVAYSDRELALGGISTAAARSMLAPRTAALMLQALEAESGDVALLVGAGSGYEAALLARLVQTVVAVEADAELARWADQALARQDVTSAVVVRAPFEEGYGAEGPYDVILINGGVDHVPIALLDQLKDGGRLVAVQRVGGISRIARWQRTGDQFPVQQRAGAAAGMLAAFERKAEFVF